jgi:hypothetical protein
VKIITHVHLESRIRINDGSLLGHSIVYFVEVDPFSKDAYCLRHQGDE